jgi:DNA-binding XRE family transcriptional regulator
MLNEQIKAEYMSRTTDNLVILRKKLKLSQVELAKRVGIGRQTLMDIENKKRPMTWNAFMSLFGVFCANEDTNSLLVFYSISTEELTKFITNR